MIKYVNDEGLEEHILEFDELMGIVFVNYSSKGCKLFSPELRAIAKKLEGKVNFYTICRMENPSISEELGVKETPTLLLFRDGDEVKRYEGAYCRDSVLVGIYSLLGQKK